MDVYSYVTLHGWPISRGLVTHGLHMQRTWCKCLPCCLQQMHILTNIEHVIFVYRAGRARDNLQAFLQLEESFPSLFLVLYQLLDTIQTLKFMRTTNQTHKRIQVVVVFITKNFPSSLSALNVKTCIWLCRTIEAKSTLSIGGALPLLHESDCIQGIVTVVRWRFVCSYLLLHTPFTHQVALVTFCAIYWDNE